MRRTLHRRAFLRGAAQAAVGLPVLDAMLSLGGKLPGARAASPRRVVFFMTGNGVVMDDWRAPSPDNPTGNLILKPLEFVKSKVLTIEGVPMTSTFDRRNTAQGHPGGSAGVLTGAHAGPGKMYGGCGGCFGAGFAVLPSIDAVIAEHLGKATRFPSYHVGGKVMDNTVARRFFYSAPGQSITPSSDPYKVYEQVFSGLVPGANRDLADKALIRRKGVLNLVMEDYRALRCDLGSEDRVRLDAHLARVDDIEKRLGLGTSAAGQACAAAAPPAGIDPSLWDELPKILAAQIDLVAMMFACDLTRVMGFQIAAPDAGGGRYAFLDVPGDFHAIGHDPKRRPVLTKVNTWHVEQLAQLVKKLQQASDGSGSVFDSTAILYSSEVGNPWGHDRKGMPWTIVGTGGGYFKTGRAVKFSGTETHAHNRLLVHFLNMMGKPARHFGLAPYGEEGPLEGLLA